MSDKILDVLSVLEEIRRERKPNDTRPIPQLRADAVQRVAYDRDVMSTTVMETMVTELKPGVTSVAALEHAIDGWLNGTNELQRLLKKQVRDQIDSREVAAFFRKPVVPKSRPQPAAEEEPADSDEADETDDVAPPPEKKSKSSKKDEADEPAAEKAAPAEKAPAEVTKKDAAAKAAAEARARAQAAEEAEAAARAQAESAAKAAAEAREAAAAAAKAEAEAREQEETEERERAEAKAKADAEQREREEAEARRKAEAERRARGRRSVMLDGDVAEFFDDDEAVNSFLRAAIGAMRRGQREDD